MTLVLQRQSTSRVQIVTGRHRFLDQGLGRVTCPLPRKPDIILTFFCVTWCDFWVSNCLDPWLGASWLSGTEVCHGSRSLQTLSNKMVNWWSTAIRCTSSCTRSYIELASGIFWMLTYSILQLFREGLCQGNPFLSTLSCTSPLPGLKLKDLRIPMLSASARGPRMALCTGMVWFVDVCSLLCDFLRIPIHNKSNCTPINSPFGVLFVHVQQGPERANGVWQIMLVNRCPCSFQLAVASRWKQKYR